MTGPSSAPITPDQIRAHVDLDAPTLAGAAVSCFVALVRDARTAAKRDEITGRLTVNPARRDQDGLVWVGALLYLMLFDQIGSAFRTSNPAQPATRGRNSFTAALEDFAPTRVSSKPATVGALYALRNSFAHDYPTANKGKGALAAQRTHAFTLMWRPGRPLIWLPGSGGRGAGHQGVGKVVILGVLAGDTPVMV